MSKKKLAETFISKFLFGRKLRFNDDIVVVLGFPVVTSFGRQSVGNSEPHHSVHSWNLHYFIVVTAMTMMDRKREE